LPSEDDHLTRSPLATRHLLGDGFIYGFSYFVQQRDSQSKRGYLQVGDTLPCRTLLTIHVSEITCVVDAHSLSGAFLCGNFGNWTHVSHSWSDNARSGMPQHGGLVRHFFHILKFSIADAIDRKERSPPTPATLVELGFLGSVFNVHLPATIDELQPTIPPGSLKNMEMACISLNSVSSANH
jgi:hypothetical protein